MGMQEEETWSGGVEEKLPATIKTELGLEVAPKPGEEWREHTAERWREREPGSYARCVEMIRLGFTNQSELARMFAPEGAKARSRNSIQALMMAEFTEDELVDIGKKSARIAEVTGIGKTTELLDKAAAAKDVGGVAMATKMMHDIAQNLNDKPATITETRVRVTVEDFMESVSAPTYEAVEIPAAESKRLMERLSAEEETRRQGVEEKIQTKES